MKLRLGTVQFGQDYGIIGQKKPPLEQSIACLDYATQNGISDIDTAEAYGDAQEIVGTFLRKNTIPREKLTISTKFLPNALDDVASEKYRSVIRDHLTKTLETLGTDYVDAYLFHSARYVYDQQMLEALDTMVKEGLTKAVGVSVYEPDEAIACFESQYVSFTQFPYSVFDQRMSKAGVFKDARTSSCNVECRSAFIQGLILLDEDQVPGFLSDAKPIITKLKKISEESGISRVALALSYVKRESSISHLVFGVDSLEQLKEDIELFNKDVPTDILSELDKEFEGIKAEIVMPSLWKK